MTDMLHHPLFGIAVSLVAYAVALRLNHRFQWLHPMFVSSGSIIVMLVALDIPYEDYLAGGDMIALLLGPATVALGVPLYKYRSVIHKHTLAIGSGVTIGAFVGLCSAGVLVWLLGGSRELVLSMLPKSTTSPISIEISRQLGGIPELSAVFSVVTGLIGGMMGTAFLRMFGIKGDLPVGVAMGTAAHGIGTAAMLKDSELRGGMSGLAMGLAGIAAAIMCIPIGYFLK